MDFPGAKTLLPQQHRGSPAVFSGVARRQNRRRPPDYPDDPFIPATSRHLETDKSCPSFPGSFFPHFPPHRALTSSPDWRGLSGNNLECPDRGTPKEMIYVPWILREDGFSRAGSWLDEGNAERSHCCAQVPFRYEKRRKIPKFHSHYANSKFKYKRAFYIN